MEGIWVMFNPWSLNYLHSVVRHNTGHLNFVAGVVIFFIVVRIINHDVKLFKYYLYALFLRRYPIDEKGRSPYWCANLKATFSNVRTAEGKKFLADDDNEDFDIE